MWFDLNIFSLFLFLIDRIKHKEYHIAQNLNYFNRKDDKLYIYY